MASEACAPQGYVEYFVWLILLTYRSHAQHERWELEYRSLIPRYEMKGLPSHVPERNSKFRRGDVFQPSLPIASDGHLSPQHIKNFPQTDKSETLMPFADNESGISYQ
jgi:hypothetical protein